MESAINEMLIVGIFLYRFNEHGQLGTEIVQRYVRRKLKGSSNTRVLSVLIRPRFFDEHGQRSRPGSGPPLADISRACSLDIVAVPSSTFGNLDLSDE
jgi:hypothetical protein